KEILGQRHSQFVSADHRQSEEYKRFCDRLARGEAEPGTCRRIARDGREIRIQASYVPVHDAKGHLVKVLELAADITAQEERIRTAVFKSAAFEGSSIAMMMVDRDLKVTHVNE